MAGKVDLTRDERALLTVKMASGVWDGMIVTQSAMAAHQHVTRPCPL
jgi:hypothetical protein